MAITPPQFLLHHDGDNVAVAMTDLQPGTLQGRSVKEGTESTAVLNHALPLGHKFALADLAEGDAIIKYGCMCVIRCCNDNCINESRIDQGSVIAEYFGTRGHSKGGLLRWLMGITDSAN